MVGELLVSMLVWLSQPISHASAGREGGRGRESAPVIGCRWATACQAREHQALRTSARNNRLRMGWPSRAQNGGVTPHLSK